MWEPWRLTNIASFRFFICATECAWDTNDEHKTLWWKTHSLGFVLCWNPLQLIASLRKILAVGLRPLLQHSLPQMWDLKTHWFLLWFHIFNEFCLKFREVLHNSDAFPTWEDEIEKFCLSYKDETLAEVCVSESLVKTLNSLRNWNTNSSAHFLLQISSSCRVLRLI
jgi:hypothetical protein